MPSKQARKLRMLFLILMYIKTDQRNLITFEVIGVRISEKNC